VGLVWVAPVRREVPHRRGPHRRSSLDRRHLRPESP